MTVPGSPVLTGAEATSALPPPGAIVTFKPKGRRWVWKGLAAALLMGGMVLSGVLLVRVHLIDLKVSDLKSDAPETRAKALLWLAEADPQDAHRTQVTAALEPVLFEGDARLNLDLDLVLRAYLHWANRDNVPTLIRMVENAKLPSWSARKTGLVMETLGKLQDKRAAGALARKLTDPLLRDPARDALTLLGPSAENAVLDYLFAGDAEARHSADELLAGYGTNAGKVITAARSRLESKDPEEQRAAAAWFTDNPPDADAGSGGVDMSLAGLLADLSPQTNGPALQALKVWATSDCLPQVLAFARRLETAGDSKEVTVNKSILIDVLARFPDAKAADAIALQLKDPSQRGKAAQALVKLGPVASAAVVRYLNDSDASVRMEAASLCRLLEIPASRQLEQTLADVAGSDKARSRAALQDLTDLRPDETGRSLVSRALNAPLLDSDPGIRDDALNAMRVWATPENTNTLVQLLAGLHGERSPTEARTGDQVAQALIAVGSRVEEAVVPLLKSPDALVRRQACWVLTEIGTENSVPPLDAAGRAYVTLDPDYFRQTQTAIARVTARQ
jgi:HEAT repeat protein